MLQRTATAWQAQIRETDLLARLGGEEFALLLPDTSAEAGQMIGHRLLAAAPEGITTSCGLALWRGEDGQLLYRRADEALYAAKAAGRNQLAVAPDHGA
jgi:diguanylate cyclase (GGDEF)-like protein